MCRLCHEAKDEGHECNPDTVKTVEELSGSAYRNCPKCSTTIFKIEGCSQMFCTNPSCHTSFDWATGRVILGRIHNPHYYEYINRQGGEGGRVIGDIQCGGLPHATSLTLAVKKAARVTYMTSETLGYKLLSFHRKLVEFGDGDMMTLPEVNSFDLNLNERIKYMLGELSEETFKTVVHQRDKHLLKKRELAMIATTSIQIMSDIYNRIQADANTPIHLVNAEGEVSEGCQYINALFECVSRAFSCVAPKFDFADGTIRNYAYFKS